MLRVLTLVHRGHGTSPGTFLGWDIYLGHFRNVPHECPTGINGIIRAGSGVDDDPLRWDMGHKIKSCSYKNTAARNARALQKSQEGPIFCRVVFENIFLHGITMNHPLSLSRLMQGDNDEKNSFD